MSAGEFSPTEFGAAFQRFLAWTEEHGDARSAPFSAMFTEHFGADPSEFGVTSESLAVHDLPNLQLALDAFLAQPDTEHRLTGFAGPVEHVDLSLTGLVHDEGFGIRIGPVRRRVVELDGGRPLPCLTTALLLISSNKQPLAVLIAQSEAGFGRPGLGVEVMAPDEAAGEAFVAELRSLMSVHNVYRGKILALGGGGDYGDEDMAIRFREVPDVAREDIVLPDGVLDVVELHTVEFAKHGARLLEGGRHLRRGLLLHGPPGTGKTLTVSYLIRCLEGRTVIVLSGGALGLISEACALARDLAPSMVVLEDVDLVAQERMMGGATSLLFELMNEIDGIGPDSDVIFLMTTNRADVLEPALAARPGRVDQAVEIPLPDVGARRQLLELYFEGLEVHLENPEPVLAATDGVSAAFIRELVRKAALLAAQADSSQVTDAHFTGALDLLAQGGRVTRAMLGGDAGSAFSRLDGGADNGDDDDADGGWATIDEIE